jgi:hypothetical protein
VQTRLDIFKSSIIYYISYRLQFSVKRRATVHESCDSSPRLTTNSHRLPCTLTNFELVQGRGGGEGNCPQNFRKPWKFGQMLGKIKKIWADLPEYMLTSGYSVTTLEQRFNSPPPESISPVRLCGSYCCS